MADFMLTMADFNITMNGSGDIIIDGSRAKQRFRNYANSEAKRLALKARDEICKEYLCTVGDFYAEFTPRVWRRQYQYLNSFTPFYQNSHGTIFYGGIDINSGGMADHYKQGSGAALESMLMGKHGPFDGRGPSGLPVLAHMEQFVDYLASYIE